MAVRAEEPKTQDVKFDAVLARAAEYLPADRLDAITQAYEFAEKCHEGQLRKTGDPYITHPVSVAYMVAHLELDQQALMAALLHDVQEDCGVPNDVIASTFGERVAKLVDGLTKLDKLPMNVGGIDPARGTLQAQNLRKMFLAMAEDISAGRGVWAAKSTQLRSNALTNLFPAPADLADLLTRLDAWLETAELADFARRIIAERRDDAARSLRCQRAGCA